jgi:hypothetical protein
MPGAYEVNVSGIPENPFGIAAHPYHLHVNPYQIKELPNVTTDYYNYFAVGDWHDTLLHSGGWVVARFQSEKFTGEYVMHCHILEHEDLGMMTYLDVTGKEGTVWPEAQRLDPGCYEHHFSKAKTGFKYL